ncbi:hypothetical protein [Prevotella aurantiaca]|uniref:Uncharacterized protein n=1 Tax=Prevotella aurantiaca TaxID=596085 RepID=A0A930HK71_9BACT|nr:hypothetical protein [Prevotella aurantiaca]MBF1383238.1 hypothetical protein [Prevotella aurantiaca]
MKTKVRKRKEIAERWPKKVFCTPQASTMRSYYGVETLPLLRFGGLFWVP